MHLSKLVDALKAIEPAELKRLDDYVHSPYFKVPLASVSLFDYLKEHYPLFSEKKVDAVLIAKKSKNLDTAGKQSTAASWLLDSIEKFWAVEDMLNNSLQYEQHRLRAFKEHGLYEQFGKAYQKAVQQVDKLEDRHVPYFEQQHYLTELSLTGYDAKRDRTRRNDVSPVLQTLDAFYAIKKVRYLCEALNRHRVIGTPKPADDPALLYQLLAPYTNEQYPYVYLFVNMLQMLLADNIATAKAHYEHVKVYLSNRKAGSLTPGMKEAMLYAQGICQSWLNTGVEEAAVESQGWLELKIKQNMLLENGRLLPIAFRNAVVIATQVGKDVAWTQQFIRKYSEYLPKEVKETELAFAQALVLYNQQNYKEAIRLLLQADAGEEAIFGANIRRYHFMCLYEYDKEDVDGLDNFLLAFRKYVQRNAEDLHQLKELFEQFIKYGRKLVAKGKEDTALISAALEKEPYFAGKFWLRDQFAGQTKRPVRGADRPVKARRGA
ncbi:MAG: hypothetical protein U0T75_00625 [Chitinophagales bacterium]